jgi:hypothetical protein
MADVEIEQIEDAPKRGYLTMGINTGEDNVRYCYALACSIKLCDPDASITLVVDKGHLGSVQKYYEHVFDYMIELPYGNSAHQDGFHGMNFWQVIHASPYEDTIYVDYDTLFLNVDTELLWDTMANGDISVPKLAKSFKNYSAPTAWRFEYEYHYKLPRLYYNIMYFNKNSKLALQWFKMADPVMQNWRDVYSKLLTEKRPNDFYKNLLSNITTYYLDMADEMKVDISEHYDLHSLSHGVFPSPDEVPTNWTDMLNYWVTPGRKIQIENSVLSSGIIHYSDETFLTDEVVNVFRTSLIERLQTR